MQTAPNPKPTDDPHDILVVAPGVAVMVPTDEELSRLARSLRHPPFPQAPTEAELPPGPTVPPVDTTFRPTAVGVTGQRLTAGGKAARTLVAALVVAACTGGASIAWQSYGDAAETMIAQWAPQRILALLPLEKPAQSAQQPAPPAVEPTAANAEPASTVTAAENTAQGVAPAAGAPSAETAPSQGSMANELASAQQEIEQLKATIADLKASQQQMSRDMAKASDVKAPDVKAPDVKASEIKASPEVRASEARMSDVRPSEQNSAAEDAGASAADGRAGAQADAGAPAGRDSSHAAAARGLRAAASRAAAADHGRDADRSGTGIGAAAANARALAGLVHLHLRPGPSVAGSRRRGACGMPIASLTREVDGFFVGPIGRRGDKWRILLERSAQSCASRSSRCWEKAWTNATSWPAASMATGRMPWSTPRPEKSPAQSSPTFGVICWLSAPEPERRPAAKPILLQSSCPTAVATRSMFWIRISTRSSRNGWDERSG